MVKSRDQCKGELTEFLGWFFAHFARSGPIAVQAVFRVVVLVAMAGLFASLSAAAAEDVSSLPGN